MDCFFSTAPLFSGDSAISGNFVQSKALRAAALTGYRAWARAQFWRTGPRVFVNSIPKAGTHLLTAELARFPGVQNSRLHLEIRKLKVPDQRTAEGYPVIDMGKVADAASTVRNGQFFTAHLYWTQALQKYLDRAGIAQIFMVRDPRDILLSRLHYIVGLRRHWLHEFLTTQLSGTEDRLRLLIRGHDEGPFVLPLRGVLESFLPWTRQPSVLTVRFEDLVGSRGGGSAKAKHDALHAIATHCGLDTAHLEALAQTATGSTPTLRKGKIGGWRDELPPAICDELMDECGDLLAAFGYDAD